MNAIPKLAVIGASLMILEVLVARNLATVFGNTFEGVALAMNIALLGLAAGQILVTRGEERRSQPSHWCRIALLGCIPAGIWVIYLLPFIVEGSSIGGLSLIRISLSLPLLCGAIPLGAAITSAFNTSRAQVLERTSFGVCALDVGSAVGAALTPLLLLPGLGEFGTFACAMLMLLACCRAEEARTREPSELLERDAPVLNPSIMVAFWVGLISMSIQLGWVRALGEVLGSTLTIFGITSATALLGAALGAQSMPALRSRVGKERIQRFCWALWLISQGLSLLILSFAPHLFIYSVQMFSGAAGLWVYMSEVLIILMVVGPPSFFAGVLVPVMMVLHGEHGRLDRGAGVLQGAQLIGGVIGLGLTAVWALPKYGLLGLFIACGILTFAVGVPQLRKSGHGTSAGAFLCGALLFASAGSYWDSNLMGAGVFQWDRQEVASGEALTAWQNREIAGFFPGKLGNVLIEKDTAQNTGYLRVGGRIEGSVPLIPGEPSMADMPTEVLLGVLPTWTGKGSGSLLMVGLGGGTSVASAVETWDGEIIVLEIEPAVKAALLSPAGAEVFPHENAALLGRTAPQLVIDDARSYLVQNLRLWDAIVIQPSEPWLPWSTPLFTPDFHELLASRVKPTGVVIQWLQLYRIDIPEFAAILDSFRQALGQVQIWYPPGTGEVLLVAGSSKGSADAFEKVEKAWSRVPGVPFPAEPWLNDSEVDHWLKMAGGADLSRLRERLEYLLPLREDRGKDLSLNLLTSLGASRGQGSPVEKSGPKTVVSPEIGPDEPKSQ